MADEKQPTQKELAQLWRETPFAIRHSLFATHALLSVRVLDPACGSGHFLLAAARRLGKELARLRTGEDEPAPERVREAIRDVVAHCIYGVDKNPLAVELCRVALWLEAHCEGKPLTFLDHRIRCGDSLVGVLDLGVLAEGIPDEAFDPVSGEDKAGARAARRRNALERRDSLFHESYKAQLHDFARTFRALEAIPDDTPEQIRRKAETLRRFGARDDFRRLKLASNAWTAAFFQRMANSEWGIEGAPDQPFAIRHSPFAAITTDTLRRFLETGTAHGQALGLAEALAHQHRFFHWPLEFPQILTPFAIPHSPFAASGGFDVVLGNPPWERIKLQEEEFFASRDPEIANAPNAAARKRLIQKLQTTNPALWKEYRAALHAAESTSRFLRGSGQYPLTGRGDINTYSVFAERMRRLLKPGGRAGIIVPTGIATDDTNKHFFADLVDSGSLVSLYDFENREKIFPAVDSRYKFSLLTMAGPRMANSELGIATEPDQPFAIPHSLFAFFCTRADHLRDDRRRFTLSPADIARLNPNTRTLPVFRTRQDAELTRAIYERVPVLVNERIANSEWRMATEGDQPFAIGHSPLAEANPWGVRFLRMFDMSNDSHLFRTAAELERDGFRRVGNWYVKGEQRAASGEQSEKTPLTLDHSPFAIRHSPKGFAIRYSPLYEAKMIWHYDHRYGTYEGVNSRSSTQLPTPTDARHADPNFVAQPWYWVPAEEVEARLGEWKHGWLLGFRDVTNATNERTAIFSLLPWVGVGNNAPLLLISPAAAPHRIAALIASLSAVVFDYVTRQKIAGVHMNFFFVNQLPVLPPSAYTAADLRFIVPRVLELVYTAWDLEPFAKDIFDQIGAETWNRWFANSEWRMANSGQFPRTIRDSPFAIRPFPWDENRRAVLRAELDAYYARLYGLNRKQLRYILDPADLTEHELKDILDPQEEVPDPLEPHGYAERCQKSTFPGETFRVLKDKETRQYGEYRTRRLVLEAWEKLQNVCREEPLR